MSVTGSLHLEHRVRVALIGTLALFVALIATAFAIGGSGSKHNESAGAGSGTVTNGLGVAGDYGYGVSKNLPAAVPTSAPEGVVQQRASAIESGSGSSGAGSALPLAASPPIAAAGGTTTSTSASDASASDAGLAATKIVKTGQLTVQVDKAKVPSVVGELSTLATTEGGYVASSNTNTGVGEPSGEVVLRIPVAHFSDAITKASSFGHVLSLTTSADDVTGHYVDLTARLHALQQTRSTYLTILGRATTIGATLAVQERIQSVQEEIDQITGQLKVLSNQTSYSTLTVDVTPNADVYAALPAERHGLSKAWHTSWSRFGRGIDSMVGAIGPIVLALLIMAVAAGVLFVGYRGVRRVTS